MNIASIETKDMILSTGNKLKRKNPMHWNIEAAREISEVKLTNKS